MSWKRKTKIVCTIGPSSQAKGTLEKIVRSGMNVARLNFSHGTHENHAMLIKNVREVSKKTKKNIAIFQDLQGPKIRIGIVPAEGVSIKKGEKINLVPESIHDPGKKYKDKTLPLQYEQLYKDVKKGGVVMLDDATIHLKIQRIANKTIYCTGQNSGNITSHKGINTPDAQISAKVITEKDKRDLKFGLKQNVDFVALSFVKSAQEIKELKNLMRKYAPGKDEFFYPKIIAKIERGEALENIDAIIKETDVIMVARGDLGVEIPPENVPLIQKDLIYRCLHQAKPVIVATQMLDSMIRNPRPTRAEVSDVSNAVTDHTDAVMLSGETATGKFPVEAVQMMSKIIEETEQSGYDNLPHGYLTDVHMGTDIATSHAAYQVARNIEAKAILVATDSGYSARIISRHRPEETNVFAITNHQKTHRQLVLSWGIEPLFSGKKKNKERLIESSMNFLAKKRIAKKKDKIVVVEKKDVKPKGKTVSSITIREV